MVRQLIVMVIVCLLALPVCAEDYIYAQDTQASGDSTGDRVWTNSSMVYTQWQDCVLWQAFPKDYTTNYYDYSQEGNDGTATNANTQPVWDAGEGGTVTSDGIDDYISFGAPASLVNLDAASVTAWVRFITDNEYAAVLAYGGDAVAGDPPFWNIRRQASSAGVAPRAVSVFCRVSEGGSAVRTVGDTVLATNTWYFITATTSGSAWLLYVNGVIESQTTAGLGGEWMNDITLSGGEATTCGRKADGVYISANYEMSELRVYGRVLSSNEQYQIYLEGQ